MDLQELLPPEFFEQEQLLPKGAPPYDDVDAAARLLNDYAAAGVLKHPDASHIFFRLVADPAAVMARAKELAAQKTDSNP